jgi:hypothetical protein
MNLSLGCDIDASRRQVEDEDKRPWDQPFGQKHLLLVAG